MRPRFSAVLFDLDGTLTESHPGILHCVRLSLEEMGLPIPPEDTLRRFIGPPLWYSYTTFCHLTSEQAEEAVERYRTHYRAGGYLECSVYPGILPLLEDLRAAGAKLAVATAKPAKMAHAVCESFGILSRVDFMSGNREDEKGMGKRGLIEAACTGLDVSPRQAVMIGDTRFDREGARGRDGLCRSGLRIRLAGRADGRGKSGRGPVPGGPAGVFASSLNLQYIHGFFPGNPAIMRQVYQAGREGCG